MATTDQELKSLNKTVSEAVNILKMYVGSSAQVKAMSEKEREMLDKWLKITDEQEEQQKRQRAFTERARDENGRFIKKREGAWGKVLDMTEATFRLANKMSFGVLGKTKNMVMNVAQHFTRFFQELKSHFLSLFGEESEWFALLGSMKDSIVSATKGAWEFLFQKTPKWAGTQVKLLRKMLALQMKRFKMDFLNKKVTAKDIGMATLLGLILAGIIKGLAGYLGDRLATLMGLGGLISMSPKFKKLGEGLAMLRKSKWLKWIDDIPYLKKSMGLLKLGIKRLLLPIAILLDVLDFMEAYEKTVGTKWDKVREGLWAALDDWIELPLSLFLNTMNLAMKMFGEEMDVQAKLDEWMKAMKAGWDYFLTGQFINDIVNFGIKLSNFFTGLINGMIENAANAASSIPMVGKELANNIRGMKMDMMLTNHPTKKSTLENARSLKAAEIARGVDVAGVESRVKEKEEEAKREEQWHKENQEAMKRIQEGTYAAQLRRGVGNWFSGLRSNGGQGDVKQVPDEIDNFGLAINTLNSQGF